MSGLIALGWRDRRWRRAGLQSGGCWRATVVVAGLLVAVVSPSQAADGDAASPEKAQEKPKAHIIKAFVTARGGQTCFSVLSTKRLSPQIYAVKQPERVVIDAANALFRMQKLAKPGKGGLIDGFRYGLLDSGQARIVIDIGKGAQVGKVSNKKRHPDLHELSISVTDSASFDRRKPCAAGPVKTQRASALGGALSASKDRKKLRSSKPVVVIDPGHGGVDPGAVVNKVYLEKVIALAVARRLAARIRKSGRLHVVMTRDKDTFVSLDGRVERARQSKADLFISLHADSLDDAAQAKNTHGAAVYILSHRASDAEAKRLADKENAADLLAGILPTKSSEGGVRNILVDLLKRETERESARLQKLLVARMRSKVTVSRKPNRSAAFRVLKQTETPAALIELGYMTNVADLQRMRRSDWQERMAGAVAEAVAQFFREK